MTTVDPRPASLRPPLDKEPPGSADRPAGPGRPSWDAFTIAGVAFGLVVVLVGGFVGYLATVSDLQQARAQRVLYREISETLHDDTGPLGGNIKEGTPVALLEIPDIDVRQVVVEGTTAAQLRDGPGHLRNTALPGQYGNSVLMGKAWTYGGPFGRLDRLKRGQSIRVTTQQGEFTYVVRDHKNVGNGHDDVIAPGGAHQLTLVTADSRLRPGGRTVVVADLQGAFQLAESGRTTKVRADERGTGGEAGAGMALFLWAQALLVVVAATTWALRRYDRRVTLLLGAPVILAVVWALYDTAARMLPATL
ncbi:sortase [Yinghuangia aomiensis]|uniref:Sortase n=1 Tax=Yinghuangia aomiensis TaxID=676205 RepID=A0ABP9I926_9ACTN